MREKVEEEEREEYEKWHVREKKRGEIDSISISPSFLYIMVGLQCEDKNSQVGGNKQWH